MVNLLFLVVLCSVTGTSNRVDGRHSTLKVDLELERQLKLINKSPIKSIHTKFGYMIDCVDINKQPSFDHPLLRNHKLQTRPSFNMTTEKTSVKISPTKSKFEFEEVMCPTGTVPIQRITKDDVHAKSLMNSNNFLAKDNPGGHTALAILQSNPGEAYDGVSGTTSIYNPRVTNKDQTSSSYIYVQNGDGTNKIIVGWHVYPKLYGGDGGTHIFSAWTADNFKKTGCYNLVCSGFFQINSKYRVGGLISSNTSIYGGSMVEMSISLKQDPSTKDWWFYLEKNKVGYFPAALFSDFRKAELVGWGGSTFSPPGFPYPPMGSGYFPDGNVLHSCYFRDIAYQNGSGQDYEPDKLQELNDVPNCYKAEYIGKTDNFGCVLLFGGPGGKCVT